MPNWVVHLYKDQIEYLNDFFQQAKAHYLKQESLWSVLSWSSGQVKSLVKYSMNDPCIVSVIHFWIVSFTVNTISYVSM